MKKDIELFDIERLLSDDVEYKKKICQSQI